MGMWLTAHVSRLAEMVLQLELAWRAFVMLTPVFARGVWDCFDTSVHSGVLLGAFVLSNQECGLRGNLHQRLYGLGVGRRRLRHASCWSGSCSSLWAACLKWMGRVLGCGVPLWYCCETVSGLHLQDVGRRSSELGLWFSGHTFCFFGQDAVGAWVGSRLSSPGPQKWRVGVRLFSFSSSALGLLCLFAGSLSLAPRLVFLIIHKKKKNGCCGSRR